MNLFIVICLWLPGMLSFQGNFILLFVCDYAIYLWLCSSHREFHTEPVNLNPKRLQGTFHLLSASKQCWKQLDSSTNSNMDFKQLIFISFLLTLDFILTHYILSHNVDIVKSQTQVISIFVLVNKVIKRLTCIKWV